MSDKKSLGTEEILTERKLGRRGMVGMITAGAVTAAGAMALLGTTACCVTGGGGRVSCSDSDPTDPAGAGRTCGGTGGARSCSDTDPSDPAGAGRHC